MITADGRVKLADFGIALLIGDKRLTASHSAIGTPTYMSPEQILRPRSVDHRTDIYSAAVVFYEMLAGRPPFDGETEYEIKKLHVEAPPPDLAALAPRSPRRRCGDRDRFEQGPDERFPSAGAFLRALQEAIPASTGWAVPAHAYLATTPEPTRQRRRLRLLRRRHPSTPRQNRWVLLGAAAVLAVGLGFGIFVLMASSSDRDVPAPPATAESARRPPDQPVGVPAAAFSSPACGRSPPGTAVSTADLRARRRSAVSSSAHRSADALPGSGDASAAQRPALDRRRPERRRVTSTAVETTRSDASG